jgi:hypothetical protein
VQEIDIEELLAAHPYLIDAKLKGILPTRQQSKGPYRYDMAFKTPGGLSLVEIKKVDLRPGDVSQLLSYCRAWGRSKVLPLAETHYLIGKRPTDITSLQAAASRSSRDIRILFIGTQIPWYLTMVGRQYRPYSEGYAKNVVHLRL